MASLNFKGKQVVHSMHLGTPFRALDIDKGKSYLPVAKNSGKQAKLSLDDNLIIHGDNLHALKALLPRYAGRIKCIYIDPPYNTGNEGWIYNDNVKSPQIKDWLKKEVGVDDLERHDKWLCMMWPRLQLLRELLAEDGVIFVSIDDNEQFRLTAIMEEIFGEENNIAQITAQTNPRGRSLRQDIARTHEYILVFSKNIEQAKLKEIPKTQKTLSEYNKKDTKGTYRLMRLMNGAVQFFNRKTRPNLFFPIYVDPRNGQVALSQSKNFCIKVLPQSSSGVEACWTWSKDKITKNPLMLFGEKKKTGVWRIYRKDYLPANGQATTKERSIWLDKKINHEVGKETLSSLFQKHVFDYPKSPELIKKCIRLISDKNAIVLDSFAGSGTTAHVVLDLNKEDGGKRKFILIECEDYAHKITAERVRRVIKGSVASPIEKGRGALSALPPKGVTETQGFTYCSLGAEISEENLIKAKNLPSYDVLARYVFHTATGETLDTLTENKDFYVGKTKSNLAVFMVYKPDKKFLVSNDSALNLDREKAVQNMIKLRNFKRAYVFAMACFVPPEELSQKKIMFCQIPFAIHKINQTGFEKRCR